LQKYFVVAIDGPAGSGKTSTARLIAEKLDIFHIDTGAMYRAVTLKALGKGLTPDQAPDLAAVVRDTDIEFRQERGNMRIYMDGTDVTGSIREERVTASVSAFSAVPGIRRAMVELQRQLSRDRTVVLEGRDIGTVVFPDARFKFYLDASIEERARRRQNELSLAGTVKTLDELAEEIRVRDEKDSSRPVSPLKKATDAIPIDTTGLTLEEQTDKIVKIIEEN
jgi:cytidylate kinase